MVARVTKTFDEVTRALPEDVYAKMALGIFAQMPTYGQMLDLIAPEVLVAGPPPIDYEPPTLASEDDVEMEVDDDDED